MTQQPLLERYQHIMPDIDGFKAIASTSLPTTFWLNRLKVQEAQPNWLSHIEPLPWYPDAFRYQGEQSLGTTWPYQLGLLQIQEAVSMLPVKLLDPQPGERVLDLCAAPGNKTAEIAVAMQNTGTVVANDRNYQRMKALGQIMRRLGLVNISMTVQDAVQFQQYDGYFDRVLADVPCSCEGTFRKRPHRTTVPNLKQYNHHSNIQYAILKKAISLCKPGGRIVYSTCTFAPEENEAVISQALAHHGDKIRCLPITLPNFIWSQGIEEWQGQRFHPDVKHAMRVWPQQNDTGGFFVAVFERLGDDDKPAESIYHDELTTDEFARYKHELLERFAIPEKNINQFIYDQASHKGIYMRNRDHQIPESLKRDVTGLLCIKTKTNFPKLSTGAAGVLGQYARRHVIQLDDTQFDAYLHRQEITLSDEQRQLCESTGFVVVRYGDYVAGMGLYLTPHECRPARLQSLYPKAI